MASVTLNNEVASYTVELQFFEAVHSRAQSRNNQYLDNTTAFRIGNSKIEVYSTEILHTYKVFLFDQKSASNTDFCSNDHRNMVYSSS